jgi:hypothetical protein
MMLLIQTIRKVLSKKRILIIVLSGAMIFAPGILFFITSPANIKVEVYKTGSGWGYDILRGRQIIIHQPVIPVFQNSSSFPSSDLALKAGKKVLKKLREHSNPSLTATDLADIGIRWEFQNSSEKTESGHQWNSSSQKPCSSIK